VSGSARWLSVCGGGASKPNSVCLPATVIRASVSQKIQCATGGRRSPGQESLVFFVSDLGFSPYRRRPTIVPIVGTPSSPFRCDREIF
jgi:hypothetical protein